jgi:mono/diheme cytochrome c family protein
VSAARSSLQRAALFRAAIARCAGVAALLGLPAAVGLADPAATAASAWSALPASGNSNTGDPLERRGNEVFSQRCAACHSPIPTEIYGPVMLPPMPGTQALAARYRGEIPAALEERTDLVAEYVRTVVRNGYISMPFFRPTELSDEDLEALLAYLTRER